METKSCELSIKAVSEGKVVATLARLGVPDRENDVLLKGIVGGHQLVAIKPQHKWDHVNLGVADVYEVGETMEAAMEFNLAIPSAKDWYEAIRFSHDRNHRQQYSFGFEVIDGEPAQHNGKSGRILKSIALAEVSPVLIGASVGSQTLSVKEAERLAAEESRSMDTAPPVIETLQGRWAVGPHSTETDTKAWDTTVQIHRIHATGAPGYFRQIYAAQNPHADVTAKSSFAFPHHFLSADGEPGAASVRACAEGLAILERYWSGFLPSDELKGIHAHLAGHLKDAGRNPPELRSAGDARYPLDDQIELVLWRMEDVLHQIDHVRDMRARKGMALTEARLGQIDQMQQFFATMCALVKMKNLDKPSDLILQELSAEARADALGRRLETMRAKATKDTEDREAAEIARRVQRWEARIRG